MAANKIFRSGPTAFGTSSTAMLNSLITTITGNTGLGTIGQPYVIVRHFRVVNTAGSGGTFTCAIAGSGGAAITAATTVIGSALSVAANSYFDWYGVLRLDSTDFLNGLASATTMTWQLEGEIGISG